MPRHIAEGREPSQTGNAAAQNVSPRSIISLEGLGAAATRTPVLVVMWMVTVIYVATILPSLSGRFRHWDFSLYYSAALAMREGRNPYRSDIEPFGKQAGLQTGTIHRIAETPTLLLCFEPLTLMKPAVAYWTWFGVNVVALFAALYLLLGPQSGLTPRQALALAALAILFQPVHDHFQYAQSQLPILLMIALMMRWLERGKDAAAGLILAPAGLLRAYPLLALGYLIVRRRWRATWWTGIGIAAGGIVTLALVGVGRSFSFLNQIFVSAAGTAVRGNVFGPARILFSISNPTINGFFQRLAILASSGGHAGGWIASLRLLLTAVGDLVVLGFAVRATVLTADERDRDGRALSIWICAMILLSPIAWNHYFVLLFVLFAGLASAAAQGRVSPRALRLGLVAYLMIQVLWFVLTAVATRWPSRSLAFIATSSSFFSLMAAYVAAYWFATDESAAEPSAELRLG